MARPGWAWAAAPLPYVALAVLLQRLLGSWPQATGNTALLAVAMTAHAKCYSLWQPGAPRRILLNEGLTRLWFAAYAVLVASWLGLDEGFVAAAGLAWAAFTWMLHRSLVRRGYAVDENVAMLGVFLAGLAEVLLLA